MYRIIVLLVILTLGGIEKTYADNHRIIVLSDIGGSDPDDQQSMVHLLTLLDRIDLEGIIYQHAWVSFNKGNEVTVTEKIFDAYKAFPCTMSVADTFPAASPKNFSFTFGTNRIMLRNNTPANNKLGIALILYRNSIAKANTNIIPPIPVRTDSNTVDSTIHRAQKIYFFSFVSQ